MTNQTIDNSSDVEFRRTILWQYDHASNLIATMRSLLGFVDNSTKLIWDKYAQELNADTATDYGLAILGTLIGVARPEYHGKPISTDLYRRFVKARFKIAFTNYTLPDIQDFLDIVYHGEVYVEDYYNMSLSFCYTHNDSALTIEEQTVFGEYGDYSVPFPAGVMDMAYEDFEHILFCLAEEQPKDPKTLKQNGKLVGGLDDSNFVDDNVVKTTTLTTLKGYSNDEQRPVQVDDSTPVRGRGKRVP